MTMPTDNELPELKPCPVTDAERRQAWDKYAAAAMKVWGKEFGPESLSEVALRFADAMLAERDKRWPR